MNLDAFKETPDGNQLTETDIQEQNLLAAESYAQKTEEEVARRYELPLQIKSPQEDVLASREQSSRKKIGHGVTDADFVELKDDGKSIFKTEKFEKERAAYLIDRFLGFGLVPPTVIGQVDGKIGSMQEFIPDAKMGEEVPEDTLAEDNYAADMMKMWLFDVIIGNTDRHGQNFLVKENAGENRGGKIYAIDHGYSMYDKYDDFTFAEEISFTKYGYRFFLGKKLPDEIVAQMKKFLENTAGQKILEDLLAEVLDPEIARVLLKRACRVAELVAEKGLIPRKIEDRNSKL